MVFSNGHQHLHHYLSRLGSVSGTTPLNSVYVSLSGAWCAIDNPTDLHLYDNNFYVFLQNTFIIYN